MKIPNHTLIFLFTIFAICVDTSKSLNRHRIYRYCLHNRAEFVYVLCIFVFNELL